MKNILSICLLLFINCVAAQTPNYIPANGLRIWLPFNGNTIDESGSNNNPINHGAVLTSDRNNTNSSAYYFDGNDSMTITNFNGLPVGSSPFSVSVWFNSDQWNYRGTLFGWGKGSSIGSESNVLRTGEEANGSIVHYFWLNDLTVPTTNLSNGWHNAVITYDGTVRKLYLDGVNVGTDNSGAVSVANTTVTIGSAAVIPGANGSDGFKGKIDDLGIWNRALTSQEINQVYSGGNVNPCSYSDTTYVTIYDTTHITIYDTIKITISTTDTLIIDVATGLTPPNNQNLIKIFPNPAKDFVVIDNGNFSNMIGHTVKITNSIGQTVFNQPVNQQQFFIDLSTWTGSGTYTVYILNSQQSILQTKSIVIH